MLTTHHRRLQVSVAEVLAYIQDIPKLVRLNPLVVAVEKDTNHDNKWIVTDRIPMIGRVRYELEVKLVEDGCDVDVKAPLGVKTLSKWRVVMDGEDDCTITEEVSATMSKILSPFVNRTQHQSHEAMLDRLEKELGKQHA